MADYEVRLLRDDGTALAVLDRFHQLQYALLTNDISACRIVLPGDTDKTLLTPDKRLEVWRSPVASSKVREGVWFIRKRKDYTDSEGERYIEATGYSGNYLLGSRIVAFYAGSSQTKAGTNADNVMKRVVKENMGSSASTARQISSTYLSVAPDISAAPSVEMAFAWHNVLNVLQDLAEASRGAGTQLYFEMAPIDSTQFDFRTFTGQPGVDHTYPSGQGIVILSLDLGNLAEPTLEEDWTDEATYIYAAGQNEASERITAETSDSARLGRSIFGRREKFLDVRQKGISYQTVLDQAKEALVKARPRLRFSARVLDVPGTQYGIQWRHGDKVTCQYYEQSYDAVIRSIQVWVNNDGSETLTTKLETEES